MKKNDIEKNILAYLAERPDAQDTFEGIVLWWLLEGRVNANRSLAMAALEDLVAKGLVLKVRRGAASFPEYYCINKNKQKEIANQLQQHNHH